MKNEPELMKKPTYDELNKLKEYYRKDAIMQEQIANEYKAKYNKYDNRNIKAIKYILDFYKEEQGLPIMTKKELDILLEILNGKR